MHQWHNRIDIEDQRSKTKDQSHLEVVADARECGAVHVVGERAAVVGAIASARTDLNQGTVTDEIR